MSANSDGSKISGPRARSQDVHGGQGSASHAGGAIDAPGGASDGRRADADTTGSPGDTTTPLRELAAEVCRPVTWHGRRARALDPLSVEDLALLRALGRAEFLVNGFRSTDLSDVLHGAAPEDEATRRKQASAITRRIRLLRAHGLVHKRAWSNQYTVSAKGYRIISALLAASLGHAA